MRAMRNTPVQVIAQLGNGQGFMRLLGRWLTRKRSATNNQVGDQSPAVISPPTMQFLESPMPALESALARFMNRCVAENLSQNTLEFYRYRFAAFRNYLLGKGQIITPEQITPSLIREFIVSEKARVSEGTALRSFITIRAFLNFLVAEGVIDESPMVNIKRPKVQKKMIKTFTPEQVTGMMKASGNGFYGCRNRAMIYVLYDCGLRATELCSICLPDVNWTMQTINIVGKGNKERVIRFGEKARIALESYLTARKAITDSDVLFVSRNGGAMDRHGVIRVVKACGRRAGITGVRISPHTFRHTCALTYVRNGGDPFSLQKLLGHSGLEMTRRYTELAQADIIEKHRQYSPGDTLEAE